MSGQTTVKEGSEKIGTLVEDVLKKAGYYDGKKKLAQ
jgi:multiple sugar transport system substrate-binding protein